MSRLTRLAFVVAPFGLASMALSGASQQFPASNPQRVQQEFQATVSAAQGWQDTGVFVEAGQRVTIQAFGTWRDRAGTTDANGRPSEIVNGRSQDVALPGAPALLLVGKLGDDGPPFRVGAQTQFPSSRQGRLFLMANGRYASLSDHRGEVSVRIVTSRAIPTPSPGGQGSADQFETNISAREVWQDSGLYIEAGQRVTIQASGTWRDRAGTTDVNGRPSQPLNGRADEVALPGAPAMMLVGKIGDDGVPFRVGSQTVVTESRPGELLFMANGRFAALDDRRGQVEVRISIPRPAPQRPPRGGERGAAPSATVDAREPWQDSGIYVEAGQRMTITASGTWGDAAGTTDADGRLSQVLGGRRNEVALPGAPVMLLVGKIGEDGQPFRIGTELQLNVPRSGQLFLMANDRFDTLYDNRGRMSVRVAVVGNEIPAGNRRGNPNRPGYQEGRGNPDQVLLTVSASEPWQDTGLYIEAGRAVTILASGTWGDAAGTINAGGRPSQILNGRRNDVPMPGAPVMMLIAKIGPQGTPFRVGLRAEHVDQRGGNLFLMANDRFDMLRDNQGALQVTVLFR